MFNIILATQTSKKNTKCILQRIHVETPSYHSKIKQKHQIHFTEGGYCINLKYSWPTHSEPHVFTAENNSLTPLKRFFGGMY